jgi:hypothetical protein
MTNAISTTIAPATTEAPVDNLRAARKASAATKKAAAKTAAPAKAPAKTAAKPTEAKTPSTKIKWQLDGPKDAKNRVAQSGSGAGGVEYAITGSGDAWTLTATKPGGKPEVVAEGAHSRCYQAAVEANAEKLA